MSTLSQFSGGGIKSIQRGVINVASTSTTATITAVNTAKTILNFCGCSAGRNTSYVLSDMARIELTNSTQITATRMPGNASPAPTVSYEVIEYF